MFNFYKLLLIFLITYKVAYCLQCIDEKGNPVDWFFAYKLPSLPIKQFKSGAAYMFMTSNNYTNWILSNKNVTSEDSLIGNTLKPLYVNKGSLHILYNDETPEGRVSMIKGHTKGVVLANETAGFWLIHSVPKFPPAGTYVYPKTGTRYGQSFLCISMKLKYLDTVGKQLQYNEPQIYSQNVPVSLRNVVPNLTKAAMNLTVKSPPWFNTEIIRSLGDTPFISFAKTKRFGKDLYEDWLAPSLKTDLIVETWPNGAGKMYSNCSRPFKVRNVNTIGSNVLNFTRTHDHSKWAVSDFNGLSWICVGDINRMADQVNRGGGTVCVKNKYLAKNYQKIVTSVERCLTSV